MQFKVIHPRRCRHDGTLLNPGDIINSSLDLAAAWPLRFQRVVDAPVRAEAPTTTTEDEAPTRRRRGRKKATVTGTTETDGPSLRAIPKGKDQFDVVNVETGKAVNESPLTEAEATSLVQGGRDGAEQAEARSDTAGA